LIETVYVPAGTLKTRLKVPVDRLFVGQRC
jgi:hypothetical protein